MADFKPSGAFNVPLRVYPPSFTMSKGVRKKLYTEEKSFDIFAGFRTFGGTEKEVNGVYSVEDTATVETWYRPDITAGCQIKTLQDGRTYDIIGTPENIRMQNQFSVFKVRRTGGGA